MPVPQEWFNLWAAACRDGTMLAPHLQAWTDLRNIPDLQSLQALISEVRNLTTQQRVLETHRRMQSRADLFEEDWASKRKLSHAFCRGEKPPMPPLMCREDGTWTGDRSEMDGMLCDAWLPIFRLYDQGCAPPSFHAFRERFQAHFPPWSDFQWEGNTVEAMHEVLRKANADTAIGVCGWRVAELKCLPDELLSMLCDVFNLIEEAGDVA